MTTDANIVNLNSLDDVEEWLKSTTNVYVGRPSQWGNPFKLKDGYSRKEAVKLYEQHVLSTKKLADSVGELTSKTLGC